MKDIGSTMRSVIAVFETRALAVWIALATTIWLFVRLASEVSEGEANAIDRKLLFLLRAPGQPGEPIGPQWLQEAMRDITALGGVVVLSLFVIAAVTGLLLHKKRRHAVVLTFIVAVAFLSNGGLKIIFDRARPGVALPGSQVYSQSFPSGHATMAATTYLTLAVIISAFETSRRDKLAAFLIAGVLIIAVGISRVYLGVHWPSDVPAGWIAGGAWALAAHIVLSRTRHSNK